MSSQHVEFSRQGSLAVITLNRPEARNALTPRMVDDLSQSLQDCRGAGIR
ncbi:MAG: enoyl-CoA hydratase-related protein, partial [Dehalococcoidia bacterium]